MSQEAIVVFCTAPAAGETAATLARGLVEAKLAACVNIVPGVRSFYSWKGAVHDDAEVQLLIKTQRGCFEELRLWLAEHHPYEVPEIIALPIVEGSASYLEWLVQQTTP